MARTPPSGGLPPDGTPPSARPARARRRGPARTLRRALILLVLFVVVEYAVLPQLPGIRDSLSRVRAANLWFVLVGVASELGSLVAYAALTRTVIPSETAPGLWTAFRIDLATFAVSHLVPGGAAAGSGLGFRLLSAAGVDGTDIGFALAAQGIGSALVLNVLLWLALVVSIPLTGPNPLYLTAAAVGIVVIGGGAGAVVLLTRGEARAARLLRWVARKLPFLDEDRMHRLVHRLAGRLRALGHDRALLWRAIGWASANWLLDAASLWAFVAAFGHRTNAVGLLVSYGLAQVLAAIPLTPGGLGVVEATLTATLVGFGVPKGIAILGVIGWRLFEFWIPIPFGGLAYLSLRIRPGRRPVRRAIREVAVKGAEESEDLRTWAERHAIALHERQEPAKRGSAKS